MPRVSKAETERNRALIEEVSSKLFREQGLKVSVADVMSAAGLTHGGFYGHFKSKDELIAIACANAFDTAVHNWQDEAASGETLAEKQKALVEHYLSSSNIKNMGDGCPLASLASDVAREDEDKPVREAFHQGTEKLVEIFAAGESNHAKALAAVSTMVGALILARANSGYSVADDFISVAKAQLLAEIKNAES
ncbi:MAG: TetR/AcrR family transcriptional regulator [Ewingella americana]|jgi:TetR/AcrR family transcriptional repressor of nem operon|uniref:TetR/AcrR family transcriptional regulator n=1 Tax=Ewingella americana TaxID=41202 RepID=UPI00242E425F|nr:TetR/AcrR family transcriptional regulator [Ewingella americana]MCI1680299.1 TetR/AcrR family transcriptional regulator [Ewingella americana]MCI1854450.1 TetR/AcrR family transcriptional regulator [Ewingella americana]MCI1860775.1 TetR/AcrR family transcriptional regulator [Ewingella americana]MCI2141096.1 TetR/AcrR family transcriptional regulator [Ewingella americana]MCI2164289.1 TetR/AcrR family transcriptional regulator [Ewingella americana]